ncbi:orotidine-5'-phosphate decarboxylase [bacterium]|nr:orotidine-5'-phosphate decarboxylase [bacterium]
MSVMALVLDQTSREDFWKAVDPLEYHPKLVLKLGLRLLPLLTADDFTKLRDRGFKLFIDVKLHDIPSQVADAVSTWADLGASFITVHLSGGRMMLKAAQDAAEQHSVQLFGVSVLTSLDENDIREIGFAHDLKSQVKTLVSLGHECGLTGFVCSPFEIESILELYPAAQLVTPGISLTADMKGVGSDQKRRMTFDEALAMGSFMPVVGRALWNAPDFNKALHNLLEQLEA